MKLPGEEWDRPEVDCEDSEADGQDEERKEARTIGHAGVVRERGMSQQSVSMSN